MREPRVVRRMVFQTLVLAACWCLPAWVSSLPAQTATTASLKGRILDDGGDGLPGVIVVLSNETAALSPQTAVTDIEGNFAFRLLPPASGYQLKASIPGFATVVAGPLDLNLGKTTVQNLTLKPASELEETVQVEARGEIVDLSSTRTATSYNSEFIAGLPIVGRQFTDILTLAPGVTDADGDGNPNVRGARDTGLQVRVDGSNATDPLSGHFAQQINLETIEEAEIITSGAPAEFGRTDGGFTNIITKSGGNDFQGSFKFFFRSDKLDGDGAGNSDGVVGVDPEIEFTDVQLFLTAGGPIVKDHLWYFGSVVRFDREEPVLFESGQTGLRTLEGWQWFAKTTWQTDPANRLTFQINYDPLDYGGNFIGPRISEDTDFVQRTGGPLAQVKWTSIVSPSLLLETLISRLDGGSSIEPVSSSFYPVEVQLTSDGAGGLSAAFPCDTINCSGDRTIYRTTLGPFIGGGGVSTGGGPPAYDATRPRHPGRVYGAYHTESDDTRERTTFRADLSLSLSDRAGEHAIKTGFEFNDERFEDQPIYNPQLVDETIPYAANLPSSIRYGNLVMDIFDPIQPTLRAEGLNAAAYVQDAWKPWPNLSLNLGLRYDHEEIQTTGFEEFNPLEEARTMLGRFNTLCAAAGSSCRPTPGRWVVGLPPQIQLAGSPASNPARAFDLNGDSIVDMSSSSPEYHNYYAPITTYYERRSTSYTIANSNLAPRLSLSWDPWSDGRTKLFGTWSRYYDRLYLATATVEQQPNQYSALWFAGGPGAQVQPGHDSQPLGDIFSVDQADHGLRTPYVDEWTIGFERELAPEWALSLTWIQRKGSDLLQDEDVNHITCEQFQEALGVDPYDVCGDGGVLEVDRFGTWSQIDPNFPNTPRVRLPNGAPDLYVLSPEFNRVLRVDNINASDYKAAEILLRKRLHRNWQMQLSYTWSEARGDAESVRSTVGNDPAVADKAGGYLDYDQRHVLKWQGVLRLPRSLSLGSTIQWASGLPWSVVSTVSDLDDTNNLSASRSFFVNGKKNDQRNEGQWTLNGRIEKELALGSTIVTAFASGENLLDSDDLTIEYMDLGQGGGLVGERRFGRRWELGASVLF